MTNHVDTDERSISRVIDPTTMAVIGLRVFYPPRKITTSSRATNKKRFLKLFGADPFVACSIWEDLQCHPDDEETYVTPDKLNPRCFLMALHFLVAPLFFVAVLCSNLVVVVDDSILVLSLC